MKFFTLAANMLLMVNAALASPLAARKQAAMDSIRARIAARQVNIHASNQYGGHGANGTGSMGSSNWAGAAISTLGVTEVTGTFTVPKLRVPFGGNSSLVYCGAVWVGIDGVTDDDLIQTGVIGCVANGEYFYEAWHEYLPAPLVAYSGISVAAGSVITVTATKTGINSGFTTLTSGGITVTQNFSGESSDLQGSSAEWIVEDVELLDAGFADFGSVTFTGACAIINGTTVTPGGDDAINIFLETSGKVLTSTKIHGSTVKVDYE